MKQRTDFYCVIQPDGAFCVWSMARNRMLSWRFFSEGPRRSPNDKEAKRQYQKEGCRCVPVRLTLVEKGIKNEAS